MRAPRRVGDGHGGQQLLRVGVLRVAEDRLARPDLDDLAEIHHRDPVADALDHRHVVRDEQVGEPELRLQVQHQVDDLRLDRDVERGDRLVGDDQLRPDGERAGDADALALAAGEFVREAARPCRASRPTAPQQLGGPLARLALGRRAC